MKASLVAKGQIFPKTHDLLALDTLCLQAGIFIGIEPRRLSRLSAYAVRVRYPGDEPTIEEAKEAVEIAKAVRRFARQFLGVR